MFTNLSCKSVYQAAKLGAGQGFALALMYGMVFVLYGIAHTSIWILARPANDVLPTLLANAVSVIIGAMFFAVLFGLAAALIQAVTLMLVYGITRQWNPMSDHRRGMWTGLITSAVLCAALLALVRGGPTIMTQVFWRQSFFFWFGVPGALYLALNAWLGSRLRMESAPHKAQAFQKKPVAA